MRNANKTHIPQFDTWFLRILRLASGTANSMHEVPVLLFKGVCLANNANIEASELQSHTSFLRYSMLLQSGKKQVIDATDTIQKNVVRNCGT